MIIHVISLSSGKDSVATLLLAIERFGREKVIAMFCDTGNEDQAVYDHLDYLEQALGIKLVRLKANFDTQIAGKRLFIAKDRRVGRQYETAPMFDEYGRPVPARDSRGFVILQEIRRRGETFIEPVQKTHKVGGGKRVRWTNKAKRRALAVLHPTGNPFLDLCLWKGRFPSRKAQFCTEELKRNIAVEFQMGLIDQGYKVVSWQGIRRDESLNRRNAERFEAVGGGLYIYRPIVDWTAKDVFAYAARFGIKPNPLYLQGMGRVGCMPCINANKAELREIGNRFPEHVARIHEWEQLVGAASKRQAATFIPAPGITPAQAKDHGIYSVIEWSRTSRGGRQYDMLAGLESSGCASSYGLCDAPALDIEEVSHA